MINKQNLLLGVLLSLIIILIITLSGEAEELTSEMLLVPYLILIAVFFILKIDPRYFGVLAILLLILSAIILTFEGNEDSANYIAISAYYSLCSTVILLLVNEVFKVKCSLELEDILPKTKYNIKTIDYKLLLIALGANIKNFLIHRVWHKALTWTSKKVTSDRPMPAISPHPLSFRKELLDKQIKNIEKDFEKVYDFTSEYLVPLMIFTLILGVAYMYIYSIYIQFPYQYPGLGIKILFLLVPIGVITGALLLFRTFWFIRKHAIHKLWSNILIFSVLSFVGNIFLYIYHLYSARVLTPTDYGVLNSVLFIMGLVTILTASLGKLVVKIVSELYSVKNINTLNIILKKIFFIGIAVIIGISAILFIFGNLILDYIHVDSFMIIILLILSILFTFIFSFVLGYLQGIKSFIKSGIGVFANASGRLLVLILILFLIGSTVDSIFATIPLAAFFAIIVLIIISKKDLKELFAFFKFKSKNVNIENKRYILSFISIIMLSLGTYLMFGPEIVILEHRFFGDDIGFYSVASNLSRIITYILLPVVVVFFPYFVSDSKKNNKLIFQSTALILSFGIVMFAAYNLFPEIIINILWSSKYLNAITYLPFLSAAAVIYTVNILLSNYLIARDNLLGGLILIISGIGMIIVMNYVPDLVTGSLFVLLTNILCMIFILITVLISILKDRGYEFNKF